MERNRQTENFAFFSQANGLELSLDDIRIDRADRIIVNQLSFSLKSGEIILLLGPNGVGKSTLLRAIAGFLPIKTGRLSLKPVQDSDISSLSHYIGHNDGLKRPLTVRENLEFFAQLLGHPHMPPLSIKEALSLLGLPHVIDLPCSYLSAGQKRRVALARLWLARRPLWLLDEPTNALDAAARQQFADLASKHLQAGGMIIAATHTPLGLEPCRELRLQPIQYQSAHFSAG